jgi:lysophospholipase L1-like esterase
MNLNSNGNSATNTYTWHSCANLKAVPYFIGFGGSGITKVGTFNTCIKAIDYFSATRKAAKISPDIIVINHGTNDSKADSNTFKMGYNKVLDKLHEEHTNTPIVCMIPFNQTHAQDIRDCVNGRSYCKLIETSNWNLTFTDTKHPNASGAERAGKLLSDKLIDLFGTRYFIN